MAKRKRRDRYERIERRQGLHKTVEVTFGDIDPGTVSAPFQGEMMTCVMCGKQQASDPAVESNWRKLEIDGRPFYVCPEEFPPDGASTEAFAAAYKRILLKAITKG